MPTKRKRLTNNTDKHHPSHTVKGKEGGRKVNTKHTTTLLLNNNKQKKPHKKQGGRKEMESATLPHLLPTLQILRSFEAGRGWNSKGTTALDRR